MKNFVINKLLSNDCLELGSFELSLLLLMNNSLVPWFILVPKVGVTELVDLSPSQQTKLLEEINLVSTFIKKNFNISKLNIAAIGNIVDQLHIHVVGRDKSDYCWPKVVWGTTEKKPYTLRQASEIKTILHKQLGVSFNAKT